MPPLPFIDRQEQSRMLQLARAAIHGRFHPAVGQEPKPPDLRHGGRTLGCFVSLHLREQLRGCIGTLKAEMPLARAIPYFARAAAFDDPRFAPLSEAELEEVVLSISLLGEHQPLNVSSREELEAALSPGEDGIWLSDGIRQATFLPCVWEQLPTPHLFIEHLLHKGGWLAGDWPAQMQVFRYPTLEFSEADLGRQPTGPTPRASEH